MDACLVWLLRGPSRRWDVKRWESSPGRAVDDATIPLDWPLTDPAPKLVSRDGTVE